MHEWRSGSVSFPPFRGNGPQQQQRAFNFTRPVTQATAMLTGFSVGFSGGDDHHLGRIITRLDTTIDADVVIVNAELGLRDWSGNWDDNYDGNLQFLVLAELDATAVDSNLSVTGVEYSQAIQFFRSQDHLDPATAGPDNSIPMAAGKDTIFRVYVDTSDDPTRPTVASVSGVLSVRLAGTSSSIDFAPLNGAIAPIRSIDIDRRRPNDTLNFLVPGAFATGEVEVSVRAFAADQPNVPGYTSASFGTLVRFREYAPLLVSGVGIAFSRNNLNIPAPSAATLDNVLGRVATLFPIGRAFRTGYQTMTFGGDLTTDSGRSDLLEAVRDLKGDDSDVYYGMIPNGVPRNGWLGQANGAAIGVVGITLAGENAAHEIGHLLGGKHPCGAGAPDNDYPTYDGFMTASIGEIGIDSSGGAKDPAANLDFMSQFSCGGAFWVSPYRYLQFAGSFPAAGGANFAADNPQETLFLSLRIINQSEVELRHSFHYRTRALHEHGEPTDYVVVVEDADGNPLRSHRIQHTDTVHPLNHPYLSYYVPIEFPLPVRRLSVRKVAGRGCEDDAGELAAVDVPCDAPSVHIVSPRDVGELDGKVVVAWEGCSDGDVMFLVRYSNDCGRTWRTVVARTRETAHEVDLDWLPGGAECLFEVLCSSGIRTSSTRSDPFAVRRKKREVYVRGADDAHTISTPERFVVLSADSFSPDYPAPDDMSFAWTVSGRKTLQTGRSLCLAGLTPGVHRINVRVPDGEGGVSSQDVKLEVTTVPSGKHTSHTHPGHNEADHKAGKVT